MVGASTISGDTVRPEQSGSVVDARIPRFRRGEYVKYPIKTIYSSEARKQIRKVLEDFQPDVVHLNNFTYQLTTSIILEIVKWRKDTGHAFLLSSLPLVSIALT